MTVFQLNMLFRIIGWTVFCVSMYPDVLSLEAWMSGDEKFINTILFYILGGFILELAYRYFSWGDFSLPTKRQYPAVVRPECPEHPWISLLDKHPEDGDIVQVFCADGIERKAESFRTDNGAKGLRVLFEEHEMNMALSPDAWRMRPTHWRYPKNEPDSSIQK